MGHKILLADDSITIQKVIELTFSDEDFELHTVGNGQKAMDEIRAIQPDVVLCDIIMPEKNGYEVCEFIKSSDDLKRIPVLLLTGAFEPFDQERAKAAGCDGFLAKPFEPQTLISKVKELLANSTGAAPATVAAPAQPVAPPPIAPPPIAPPPIAPPPIAPPPPMPDFATVGPIEDETVLVQPPSLSTPPPVTGPQVPAAPPPPPFEPPPPPFEPPALDDAFAIEAGERELAMDAGDHTMLLGPSDVPAPPLPPPPSASVDDIWNEMPEAPPEPPPFAAPFVPEPMMPPPPAFDQDADAATVFMSAPPEMVDPNAEVGGAEIDNELNAGETEDPDATWQVPEKAPAATPPPQLDGDIGGFGDFAAPESAGFEPPGLIDAAPPAEPLSMAVEPEPFVVADPFTPPPADADPLPPLSSIPLVDPHATMGPVHAGADAPPQFTPPIAPEPSFPEVPEPPEALTIMNELEATFNPVEPFVDVPAVEPPPPESAIPMDVTPPSPPAVTSSAPETPVSADDDLVERVAQLVVDKLSSKVIQEIAWEVVPDLAEGLIQKEIDALKAKIPKTG